MSKTIIYKIKISLFVLLGWSAINFLLFFPSKNGFGSFFGVIVMYTISSYAALGLGILLLLTRLIRLINWSASLLYILIGILNLVAGLLGIILYLSHSADRSWLNKSLWNLLVGVLMLADTFFLPQKKQS